MSHISTIKFNENWDLATLQEMCEAEDYLEFISNRRTYKWFGKHVGDYPLPDGFTVDDMGKCHHVIRVRGASYEIGVVVKNGKIHLLWDFWSSGGLQQALGREAGKLIQSYTLSKGRCTARKTRRRFREVQGEGYREVRIAI